MIQHDLNSNFKTTPLWAYGPGSKLCCRIPETGNQQPAASIRQPVSSNYYRHPASSNQQLEARDQQLEARDQHPASSNQQPVSSIQYPVSGNPHPATRNAQPASSNQQPESSIQTGFTLLEVLIAMAIMAIVLISVYRLHSQTLSMAAATRFYTQAPLLAQSKMAQLEAMSSNAVSGDSGDFGEKFPGYGWSVSTEDVSSEALGDAAADLKRIDVTVTLNENDYAYTARLYRMMSE